MEVNRCRRLLVRVSSLEPEMCVRKVRSTLGHEPSSRELIQEASRPVLNPNGCMRLVFPWEKVTDLGEKL